MISVTLFEGPRCSGKTNSLVKAARKWASNHKNCHVVFIAPTLAQIKILKHRFQECKSDNVLFFTWAMITNGTLRGKILNKPAFFLDDANYYGVDSNGLFAYLAIFKPEKLVITGTARPQSSDFKLF